MFVHLLYSKKHHFNYTKKICEVKIKCPFFHKFLRVQKVIHNLLFHKPKILWIYTSHTHFVDNSWIKVNFFLSHYGQVLQICLYQGVYLQLMFIWKIFKVNIFFHFLKIMWIFTLGENTHFLSLSKISKDH